MKLNPIVKWSGSKRSQASKIVSFINKSYDTYYEPFCGGCSVLFYILNYSPDKFLRYVCSDVNKDLINVFNIIKNHPEDILESYEILWNELNKDSNIERKKCFFNNVRERFNKLKDPLLFFFIMRTTTNGMPRYNSKGEFNNSFHITRNGIDPDNLRKVLFDWSNLLNKYDVNFIHQSYDNVEANVNDFMYLDPPYFNTKGMYYGSIDYKKLWKFLEKQECDYILSFDGIAGGNNLVVDVPKNVYNKHLLIESGNSSFRRVIGKSKNTLVLESLYIKCKE